MTLLDPCTLHQQLAQPVLCHDQRTGGKIAGKIKHEPSSACPQPQQRVPLKQTPARDRARQLRAACCARNVDGAGLRGTAVRNYEHGTAVSEVTTAISRRTRATTASPTRTPSPLRPPSPLRQSVFDFCTGVISALAFHLLTDAILYSLRVVSYTYHRLRTASATSPTAPFRLRSLPYRSRAGFMRTDR